MSERGISGCKYRSLGCGDDLWAEGMAPQTRSWTSMNKPGTKSNLEGVPKSIPAAAPRKHARRGEVVKNDPTANPRKSGVAPFTKLPFELFIEIARWLCPLDVVQLARVNKSLRELLMHRSAISIWRTARSNVHGLPPCPGNISEPQYATLLFLEECSTCSEVAPQNMDPILQVRLCAQCIRKVLADVKSFSMPNILLSSKDILPTTTGVTQRSWCIYEEAEAIETELRERQTGNQRDLTRWINERVDLAKQRYEQSRPLAQWLRPREEERQKRARKTEIEARLLKLGWEQTDLESEDPWDKRQWMSLVYNTQPLGTLNSRAWKQLLPSLVHHIEINRKHRRRSARQNVLEKWLVQLRNQNSLKPLATATPNRSVGNNYSFSWWCPNERIYRIIPWGNIWKLWPESKALLETDIAHEAFETEFEAKKGRIAQQIDDWRIGFELSLVEMLPNETLPIDGNSPDFKLTTDSCRGTQSLDCLPLSTRKLLRADSTFVIHNRTSFYPNDFDWLLGLSVASYDPDSAVVAKALLHVLGRPNATYLEMNARKKYFLCGRCNTKPVYRTWKEIIQHYREEEQKWQRQSRQVAQRIHAGEKFTLVFTHDIDLIDIDNPLVRTGSEGALVSGNGGTRELQRCNLCNKFGIVFTEQGEYLRCHIRDVHFIGDPVEGLHYQSIEDGS